MELSLSAFFSALLMAVSRYYPESEDPDLKPLDTPQSYLAKEYDFIIVGAGSAGCVLANRLTENKDWKVLLIEAGGDEDAISDTPFLALYSQNTDKDWNYTSFPQKYSCLSQSGVCSYPRGRVMGGSSTINYMAYVRGNKEDYNEWERAGNIGWGYRDVLPYFIKAEHINIPSLAFSPVHGADGPLSVQYSRFQIGSREDYVRACEEVGFHLDDYNNGIQRNVVGYFQFNIKGPSRHSASAAYVSPIRHRKNLHVIKRSLVKKILIENKKAKGVQYIRNGEHFNAYGKEVILSAGSFDTPKLLMMSGVGPKKELQRLGIPVIEDLPVGKALKDHVLVNIFFELQNGQTFTPDLWRTSDSILSYARDKQGPLTAFPSEVHAFFNPLREEAPPTIQLLFLLGYADAMGSNKTIITMGVALVYPKSVGNLRLKSRDYNDPPLIDPNFFDDEIDSKHVRKGIDKVFEIMETSSMKKFSPKLFTDFQPACRDLPLEEFKDCIVVQYSNSYSHPVGTARMGPPGDPDSVVCSADLVVRGIKNLRVVDASVMPQTPRANTHAPTVMVAEKASDIIKHMYKCSRKDGYSEKPKNNNRRGF